MPKVYRRDDGQPLRDALEEKDLSMRDLAEKTKEVDPSGRGVSRATIAVLAGQGKSSRDACEVWTAWLVAEGLDWRIHRLFRMPSRSTVTEERSRADVNEG